MNCNNRISASAMLVAASLAFSPAAWSLGLGEAKVESYLNQPLRARIDLISQASDDLTSVTARLASADDYELIGASIEGISVPLRFTVEDIEGDAYIAATSNLPITDPVLRVIVEVTWSSGRMLREYTLFLDPPVVPEAAPAPRISQSKPATTAPAAASPQATTEPVTPAAPAPVEQTRVAPVAGEQYGPVQSGQTLWGIASTWSRGSGLDVNRVMIAIQKENPGAFLNDNINLLKRGAILRMPDAAQIEQISAAAAYREVQAQAEEFSGGRAARSVASPATPLLSSESSAARDSEAGAAAPQEVETPAVEPEESLAEEEPASGLEPADRAVAGPDEDQDLLELIPPSADSELDEGYGFEESAQAAAGGEAVQTLRENLARTEEELIAQQQQNSYLEERIRELETELESAGEGPVADADLANMQDRLRDERQAVVKQAERSEPWYSRLSFWLIGLLLVVVAGLAGWLLSRRGQAAAGAEAADESLRSIQSEAEDVLRVLGDDSKPETAATGAEPETEVETATKPRSGAGAGAQASASEDKEKRKQARSEDDAELLDEESSDPEIQLDLARAYISMGDKEAARVILEEVVNNGSEEQQAEAKNMLGTL